MNLEKLRKLWDGHAKAVYAYLLQLTRSEADAKDFLQDVFWQLARQPALLDRLDEEPRGYLLRQARNLVVDQARRGQVRERVFAKINALRNGEAVDGEDPDNLLIQRALTNALRQLPEDQRSVVHARLWKKQTLDAIATELGISINTAGSRYRYGLDKMREHLRSLYEDLAPRASRNQKNSTVKTSKTKLHPMKDKSNTPFNGSPEEPLIQALEQRRVPSGTGFELPALPMPEDCGEAEAAVEAETEVFFEKPDIGLAEGEVGEGELILLEDGVELPVTFEEVFPVEEIGDGGGEEGLEYLYDLDVTWATGELYGDPQDWEECWIDPVAYDENGHPVDIKYMTFGLPEEGTVVEGEGEVVEGEITDGEITDGEVVDGEVIPEGEVFWTFSGNPEEWMYMSGVGIIPGDVPVEGEVDPSVEEASGEDGAPVEKGDPVDDGGEVVSEETGVEEEVFIRTLHPDGGGYVTEDGEYVGFDHSWVQRTFDGEAQTTDAETPGFYLPMMTGGPGAVEGETFDPSLIYASGAPSEAPTAGGKGAESPEAPEVAASDLDHGQVDTAQPAAAAAQPSGTAETGNQVVFFANGPTPGAIHDGITLPTTPVIALDAASTSHEFAAFVPAAAHHGLSDGTPAASGDSSSEIASGHTIGQWVPVGNLSSVQDGADAGALHGFDTEHAVEQAITTADAGALSSGATPAVAGSSAAMAVTGAAMLARDAKAADRKKRE